MSALSDDVLRSRIRRLFGSQAQPTEPPRPVVSLRKPSRSAPGFANRARRLFLDGREPVARRRPTRWVDAGQMSMDFGVAEA